MSNITYGNYGRLKSPCTRDCPNRKAGCVTDCEALHEYEEEKRKVYQERLERTERERVQGDLRQKRWERTSK